LLDRGSAEQHLPASSAAPIRLPVPFISRFLPALLPALRPTAVAAVAGLAHALSFAPWNVPPLQVAAQAVLFWLLLHAPSWRRAALLGLGFGLAWFGLGVHWVYISMHTYGQMPAVLAAAATAAFCGYLALYPALAAAAAHRLAGGQACRMLGLLPASWTAAEWLRGTLLTGFPWLASGYAHSDGPLAGYAPVLGVYGITLCAALVASAVVLALWPPMAGRTRALGATLIVLVLGGGQALRSVTWTRPAGPEISVRLLQGNIPQDMKFSEQGLERTVATHRRLLQQGQADLTALPESVYPLPLGYLPDVVTQDLFNAVRGRPGGLVFGIFLEKAPGDFYNSAVGLRDDEARPMQTYSKRHLVPFGEFIPPGFRWFVDLMQMPIGDQRRGDAYQPPLELAGQRIAVNICYEDLFGSEIAAAWADPAREPTLMLNLSNLAWFDDSIALPQHLQISRLRALETGRPMLRATNTGATAIIDARGQVTAQLPPLTEGVLEGRVRGADGRTPYLRFADWPVLAALLVWLVAGVFLARAARRS
jgi:apolipoprotein N-acyltransferase